MSMHDDIEKVLVSEEQLKAKVAELGAQISKDYERLTGGVGRLSAAGHGPSIRACPPTLVLKRSCFG